MSQSTDSRPRFLNSTPAQLVSLVLVAHILLLYGFSREEPPPSHRPLAELPAVLDGWRLSHERVVDEAVQEVLQADDTVSRTYRGNGGEPSLSLFAAYFRSQRTGVSPHSPKNCLPGAGWYPVESGFVEFLLPGRSEPARVNRYLVARGDNKTLVLYWYQSRDRVIASEYAAKFYLIADAIRYNRTDTSLIRIAVPVTGGDTETALRHATGFAQQIYRPLRQSLPS